MNSSSDITELLVDWGEGDQAALEKLIPMVEKELRRIAHNQMRRESPGHTLQTTALVNEAYLRLVDQKRVRWQNRSHFFAIAAKIMRRILLNYARDRDRDKRGGGAVQVSLSDADAVIQERAMDLIALDQALNKLELIDERKCRVVELRFFAGLSVEDTAEALDTSAITVIRDWNMAKAWLARELSSGAYDVRNARNAQNDE
jgi:RNA polymerase sigma factor (TIGR02999 family)